MVTADWYAAPQALRRHQFPGRTESLTHPVPARARPSVAAITMRNAGRGCLAYGTTARDRGAGSEAGGRAGVARWAESQC